MVGYAVKMEITNRFAKYIVKPIPNNIGNKACVGPQNFLVKL